MKKVARVVSELYDQDVSYNSNIYRVVLKDFCNLPDSFLLLDGLFAFGDGSDGS